MSFQKIVDAAVAYHVARDRALKADRRQLTAAKAIRRAEKALEDARDELTRARNDGVSFAFEQAVREHEQANNSFYQLASEELMASRAHERALEQLEEAKAALDALKF